MTNAVGQSLTRRAGHSPARPGSAAGDCKKLRTAPHRPAGDAANRRTGSPLRTRLVCRAAARPAARLKAAHSFKSLLPGFYHTIDFRSAAQQLPTREFGVAFRRDRVVSQFEGAFPQLAAGLSR